VKGVILFHLQAGTQLLASCGGGCPASPSALLKKQLRALEVDNL